MNMLIQQLSRPVSRIEIFIAVTVSYLHFFHLVPFLM